MPKRSDRSPRLPRGHEPWDKSTSNWLNWYVPQQRFRTRLRRIVRDYAYDEGIPVSEALYVLILRGSK